MIVYDNVNFKDTVRDKVLGYIIIIRNLIIAAIVIYLELPDSSLPHFMYDGTKNFNIRDIFNTPAISNDDNDIGVRISIYLISEAIKKMYGSIINTIFNGPPLSLETETTSTIFIIPEIDRMAIYKIKF